MIKGIGTAYDFKYESISYPVLGVTIGTFSHVPFCSITDDLAAIRVGTMLHSSVPRNKGGGRTRTGACPMQPSRSKHMANSQHIGVALDGYDVAISVLSPGSTTGHMARGWLVMEQLVQLATLSSIAKNCLFS